MQDEITIVERESLLAPRKREYNVHVNEGAVVYDYIPEHYKSLDVVGVFLNHQPLNDDKLMKRIPKAGDRLTLVPHPGFVQIVVGLVIWAVSLAAQWGLAEYDRRQARKAARSGKLGPTYTLDTMANTIAEGSPIPFVYGTHRMGGQVIQQYSTQFVEGRDLLNTLLGICEGPINDINPNGLSDLHIDGNVATLYPNIYVHKRLGTNTDTVIKRLFGADGSVTTITAANQLTYGAAITKTGTASADRFKLKVYFATGLYFLDNNQFRHDAVWQAQVRYRTTAGPGAWNTLYFPAQYPYLRISANSDAGSTRVYIETTNGQSLSDTYGMIFSAGEKFLINWGGPRQETCTVSGYYPSLGYIDVTGALTYDHTADDADYVSTTDAFYSHADCRVEPFSIWIENVFPSKASYDIEITRLTSDHNASTGRYSDAYLYEYQQIADDSLIYPNIAKIAIQAAASDMLTGETPRFTSLIEGRLPMAMASATTFSAPAFSNNPANVASDIITHPRSSLKTRIDQRFKLTLNTISGPFTVGEEVLGPANDYQFKGVVRSYSNPEIVIESTQGIPYTSITGQTSSSTANITSIDEAYGFDMARLWEFHEFCDEQVPDGSTVTTVDADSNSGQKVLNVASTAIFLNSDSATTVDADSAAGQKVLSIADTSEYSVGDSILIHSGGAREECRVVASIQGTESITLVDNLSNAHTAAQADDVTIYNTAVIINYGGAREESGTIDTIQGGASITLTANLSYTHTGAQADEVSLAENRAEFDYVFDGDDNGYDVLERIAVCSRAMLYEYGGKIYFRPLKSATPGQLITMGNIRRGSFQVSYLPKGIRPNILDITYKDKNQDYQTRTGTIEDPAALTNSEPLVRSNLELFGITRESQANREAYFRLKRLRYTGKLIKFKMGIESIDFEVGDVFYFQHDMPGIGSGGGRVVSSTNSTVTLDNDCTISGGETIRIRHNDDTQETQTLTSAAGTHRLLSIAAATWTSNPSNGDVWAVGTLGRYRAVSIKPDEDQSNAEIIAEEDDSAYYVDDYGVLPTFTASTLPDPKELPPDVENVTLKQGFGINPNHQAAYFLDVGFTKPDNKSYSKALIYFKELSAQVLLEGRSDFLSGSGNGEFRMPKGICSDGTYVYIADKGNHRIVKLNLHDLSFVANIGSQGNGNAQFESLSDVATDGTHLWIADTENHRIQKLTVAGVYVDELGTKGAGADQFQFPFGICHDGSAFVYVTDTYNHRAVKIDDALDGNAGAGTWSTLGAQGAGADQFEAPMGIDVSGSYYYVSDTQNHRIVKSDTGMVGSGGGTWTTIGSSGSGDDNFYFPSDIATDGTNVWVADTGNHRYHNRLASDLSHVDDVGAWGNRRNEFKYPDGIAVQGSVVLIAERGNHRAQARDYREIGYGAYHLQGETETGSYRIWSGIAAGESYQCSVVSVSPYGNHKLAVQGPSATIDVVDASSIPPDITDLAVTNLGSGGIRLTWGAVTYSALECYEIRCGETWAAGQKFATTTATSYLLSPMVTGYSRTYWIAAKSTSDVYSTTPDSVTYTPANNTRAWPGNRNAWNLAT